MNDLKSTEDYKFRAELTWPDKDQVLIVPCKLFLPKRVNDRPQLIFYPDSLTWHLLGRSRNCELRGILGEGVGSISIIASEVRFGSGSQRCWGNGLDEGYLFGYPKQIRINKNMGQNVGKEWAVFYLTESLLLSPVDLLTYSYDGSVQVEHAAKIQFSLTADCQLSFEYEYRYDLKNAKEKKSWSELVARADIVSLPAGNSPEDLLPLIDDLLLLVSLAEGQRCACMEIAWSNQDQFVRLFRLDRTMPEENASHSMNDCLIADIGNEFELFLKNSFDILKNLPERNLLWSALASITWFETSTIGQEFLRLFTAVETIVLAFRRMNCLEYAVDDDSKRDELRKDIEKYLKKHPLLQENPACRGMMYDNIPGLFRISLRRAIEVFTETYKIRLDDVWPLFTSSSGWSLLSIRNKIAHGEHFSEGEWFDIAEANRSLRVIAERFLLSVLGWDYQKSRSHWGNSTRQNWTVAHARLSESTSER